MPPTVALVAPPSWYYAAVPADLTWASGALRAAGIDVRVLDLSARTQRDLLGRLPGWAALQDPAAYLEPELGRTAAAELHTATAELGQRYRARLTPRGLSFPDADGAHLPTALRVGLDPARNPALPTLWAAVDELRDADIVAILMVHPEQRVGAPALARLLRESGHQGTIVLFGALEDVLSPLDLGPDILGEHELWRDLDGVILGEAESALVALARGEADVPNLLRAGSHRLPPLHQEDLSTLSEPSFEGLEPALYPYPEPVVDLRVGRGCSWGRCAFCAIQAHQPGYRSGGVDRAVRAMASAHIALGTRWFRLRDDLLSPRQLAAIGTATSALPFRPRWTARVRFSPALTQGVLATAAAGGLDELWLGLESASARVRERMDKGVRDDVVERVLSDCAALGVRVRALCLLGFPGETEAEARHTLDFLDANAHRLASICLTPFRLERRSPLAAAPEALGIELFDPAIPRTERLSATLTARWPDALPSDLVAAMVREGSQRFAAQGADLVGPTLEHAWLRDRWSRPT